MPERNPLDRIEDKVDACALRLESKLDHIIQHNAKQDVEIASIKAHVDKFDENIKHFYEPEGAWGSLTSRVNDIQTQGYAFQKDTEARLRKLEESVVKHTVYSAIGASISAAAIAAFFEYFLR